MPPPIHRNQLARAAVHPSESDPPSTVVEFEYDFARRLISRSINGGKTWILYDRTMPIAEFADGSAGLNAFFFYGLDRIDDFHGVWRAGTGERWFLKDHLGSVRGTIDGDGVLQSWVDYDAFGNLQVPPPGELDPIRFAGRFWNEALGLYENRDRFYDPLVGRFTQEDPMGLEAGDVNVYRYAFNNPLLRTDPTGRLAAIEYASLASALARPGVFCSFAVCVADLWEGVTNSVVNLAPMGNPKADCGAELIGIPCLGECSPADLFGLASGVADVLKKPVPPGVGEVISLKECHDDKGT